MQPTKSADADLSDLALALRDVFVGMRRSTPGTHHEKAAVGLLSHLLDLGPVRASDLAERACLDPSTVSRHLKGLESAGYLMRTPDPDDGRATVVEVSPEGRRLLTDAIEHRTVVLRRALAGWPAADVAALTTLVRRLADDLETA